MGELKIPGIPTTAFRIAVTIHKFIFKGQHMLNNECGENYLIFRLILGGHTSTIPLTFILFALEFLAFQQLFFTTWFQFFLRVASATPRQPSGLFHTSPASISCTGPERDKMKSSTHYFDFVIEGITLFAHNSAA